MVSHWQVRFRVPGEASEALGDALSALGAVSVTMENGGADEFFEAAYPQRPDWPQVDVTGLFEPSIEPDRVVAVIRSDFAECTRHEVVAREHRGRLAVAEVLEEREDLRRGDDQAEQ